MVVTIRAVNGVHKTDYILDGTTCRRQDHSFRRQSLLHILQSIFLPEGYPSSVTRDYIHYQRWDTSQAFCSTIMGILCTEALLRGFGVGNASATASGAVIQWVGREGLGKVGRILFSTMRGTDLDCNAKRWRLAADGLNDLGMALELFSGFFPALFFVLAAAGNVCKAIVGVAGGATRAALTQHFARRGNFADVAAKDDSQEMLVGICGMCCGLIICRLLDNVPAFLVIILFLCVCFLHFYCNYRAVRAVCLLSLNEDRINILLAHYVRCNGAILSPAQVQEKEHILLPPPLPPIFLGSSLEAAIGGGGDLSALTSAYVTAWVKITDAGIDLPPNFLDLLSAAGWNVNVAHLSAGHERLHIK